VLRTKYTSSFSFCQIQNKNSEYIEKIVSISFACDQLVKSLPRLRIFNNKKDVLSTYKAIIDVIMLNYSKQVQKYNTLQVLTFDNKIFGNQQEG